jgi:molybdopterin-guanine dinucleotide biosynthesis protein A
MGIDKAHLPFMNTTMVEYTLQKAKHVADELLVTTNVPDRYRHLGVRLVKDVYPGRGALGGLYTALVESKHDFVGVLACDMPFFNPHMLRCQYDLMRDSDADCVIPRSSDGLQPFHAIYRRKTCLPLVLQAIENDLWKVDSWFGQAHVNILEKNEVLKFDPRNIAFFNINSPEDLELAKSIATELEQSHTYKSTEQKKE